MLLIYPLSLVSRESRSFRLIVDAKLFQNMCISYLNSLGYGHRGWDGCGVNVGMVSSGCLGVGGNGGFGSLGAREIAGAVRHGVLGIYTPRRVLRR